jgi:hypothetical protein
LLKEIYEIPISKQILLRGKRKEKRKNHEKFEN